MIVHAVGGKPHERLTRENPTGGSTATLTVPGACSSIGAAMTSNRVELAPHYYRDNFLRLCDTVEGQYADMLDERERDLLARWRALPFAAQCLYVRLLSRTGPWFRQSALAYPELGPTGPALTALLAAGMACEADGLSAAELGRLFTRAELARLFTAYLERADRYTKAQLLCALDALALAPAQLLAVVVHDGEPPIVAPLHLDTVSRLQLLFFGNRHQSLTEFVLGDLGVTRYWPYRLDRAGRYFPDRGAFDEYLACAALADRHRELSGSGAAREELAALATDLLAVRPRGAPGTARWQRLAAGLGRDLERSGNPDLALALYRRGDRHPARERRARVLERRGHWRASRAVCQRILDSPRCEAEGESAARIMARVQRKLGGTPARRARDCFAECSLTLTRGTQPVESQVAAQLAPRWTAVHYVENRLMNTLFGLAFWEQIFTPVPGVFHHPYQRGPSDLYDPEFRRRREALVSRRLAELGEGDLGAILVGAYREYANYACRWVNWRHIDCALIESAVRVIPAAHLLAVFERLLFDPRENRRGFPDLIALGPKAGDYRLIEVKAPGDALQDSQKRWLRFFARQGIPAEVARVRWRES